MSAAYTKLLRQLLVRNDALPVVKQGLQNSHRLHAALGAPTTLYNTVHVAGTNGKGSVAWKLAKALQASGLRTGLFVSPHISCFRERFRVNGEMISERELLDLMPHVLDTADRAGIPATFFEVVTLAAMAHFARARCDVAVLETGLGGRLDSTNVVARPLVSVITGIGLDHTKILGSTIEEVAREKAGIIKPGVPVVAGPAVPPLVREHAAARAAPYVQVGGHA